ncbi:MAG: ABC transporter permease [Lentisphaerae bacterium]|nr:ABC transporter permease [Lentisphaerota bacterium]
MRGLAYSVWLRRELLLTLVLRNLKIRYKSSVLGFFWSLLTPLCFILIYGFFAGILKFNDGRPRYFEFLVVGIVCWQFFLSCMNDSLHAVTGNVNLIKKTSFPRIVLPLSTVLANMVNFLLTSAVLLAYLLVSGVVPVNFLWLIPALAVQAVLCLGISMLVCAGNVFFRDTEHFVGILSLAWFFVTPVFYPLELQMERLPDGLEWAAFLNPMTGIVCLYRRGWMGHPLPPGAGLLVSAAAACALLAAGLAVFQSTQSRFADEL